jgi:hypothetical protein
MAWFPSLSPPLLDSAWFPAPVIGDDGVLTILEDEYDAKLLDIRTAPGIYTRVTGPAAVEQADSDEEDSEDDDPS